MKYLCLFILLWLSLLGCQKEEITIGTNVQETFILENKGASMNVNVFGNTGSKVFIIIVHGGPGGGSLGYRTSRSIKTMESDYAMVYWDQRLAGASQGGANGNTLTLENYVEDLDKLITVLKYRYGNDLKIFLYGHSWGGFLAPAYLAHQNNQNKIQGWIQASGAADFDSLSVWARKNLLEKANEELAAARNTKFWEEVKEFCEKNTGKLTTTQLFELNRYGHNSEEYIDEIETIISWSDILNNRNRNVPITANLITLLNPANPKFLGRLFDDLPTIDYTQIKTPLLVLHGQFDFVCPKQLGEYVYEKSAAPSKKIVLLPRSGHSPFLSKDSKLYWDEFKNFIDTHL